MLCKNLCARYYQGNIPNVEFVPNRQPISKQYNERRRNIQVNLIIENLSFVSEVLKLTQLLLIRRRGYLIKAACINNVSKPVRI
jgi:hypothetical protein